MAFMIPNNDVMRLRLRLLTDEYFEVLRASMPHEAWQGIRFAILHIVAGGNFKVNFPEFMSALGDLDYVVEGTRMVCGVISAQGVRK